MIKSSGPKHEPCGILVNVVVSDDAIIAESFDEYFVDIAKGLGIAEKQDSTNIDGSSDDTLQATIGHSSVAKVRTIECSLKSFSFHQILSKKCLTIN